MPTDKELEKFHNTGIAHSEFFQVIMQKYDLYGKHMSARKFWNEHIKKIDPNITYKQWIYFVNKLNDVQRALVVQTIEKSKSLALTEAQLEQGAVKHALKIGFITLEAIAENPEILASMTIEERLAIMWKAVEARDRRASLQLKKRHDDREETLFENFMSGAQYGGIDAEQIEDPKPTLPVESIPIPTPEPQTIADVVQQNHETQEQVS